MSGKRKRLGIGIAVALGATLGMAGSARATLGGDRASIAENLSHLRATRQVKRLASGERHELRLPSKTLVHQYLSPSGTVYAVSWRGRSMPDLRELLGARFAQLSTGRRRGGHHQLTLGGDDLVVETSAHGRRFSGRAFIPSLVPAGVDLATIGSEEE